MMFPKFLSFSILALAATALPSRSTPDLSLADVVAAFKQAGVVPDVLHEFNPVAFLYETFTRPDGSFVTVTPGTVLVQNDTHTIPEFSVAFEDKCPWDSSQRFVLTLVDPDAPSAAAPTKAQIRHLLATDLYLDGESTHVPGARVLVSSVPPVSPYVVPNPGAGSGNHRYTAVLYAQPPDLNISFLNVTNITNFNIEEFAERANLCMPLAGDFFIIKT